MVRLFKPHKLENLHCPETSQHEILLIKHPIKLTKVIETHLQMLDLSQASQQHKTKSQQEY